MKVIKTFKKSQTFRIEFEKKLMANKGYRLIEEEELQGYSKTKGLVLGLIFLPLALLGSTAKVRLTWEK